LRPVAPSYPSTGGRPCRPHPLTTVRTRSVLPQPGTTGQDGGHAPRAYGRRFILGLGTGWHEEEYRAYGYDYPSGGVRVAQLAEAIEIIRAMWTQSPAGTRPGRQSIGVRTRSSGSNARRSAGPFDEIDLTCGPDGLPSRRRCDIRADLYAQLLSRPVFDRGKSLPGHPGGHDDPPPLR
jgi:hypothetical protein